MKEMYWRGSLASNWFFDITISYENNMTETCYAVEQMKHLWRRSLVRSESQPGLARVGDLRAIVQSLEFAYRSRNVCHKAILHLRASHSMVLGEGHNVVKWNEKTRKPDRYVEQEV